MITSLHKPMGVGGQPDRAEIAALAREGYKSILNLRRSGEEEQPLSPEEERKAAVDEGLAYAHVPIQDAKIGPDVVRQFLDTLANLPAPVYIHCRKGGRATAMALLHMGVETGLLGNDLLALGAKSGLTCHDPEWRDAICRHVNQRVFATG